MKVAGPEDVLLDRYWHTPMSKNEKSKRQKDLADIFRLVDAYPELKKVLLESLKSNKHFCNIYVQY